jgi:microcystin-dependent protein
MAKLTEISSGVVIKQQQQESETDLPNKSVRAANLTADVQQSLLPTGCLLDYAGSTAPTGFLICDGSTLLVSDYPSLFAVIGNMYGGASPGINFALPDLRGRVVAGLDNGAASRLTVAGSGIDSNTLGAAGGEQTHLLTGPESGVKSHGIPAVIVTGTVGGIDGTHTHSGGSTGNDAPDHAHTQNQHRHDVYQASNTGGSPTSNGAATIGSNNTWTNHTAMTDYQTPTINGATVNHQHSITSVNSTGSGHGHTFSSGTTTAQTIAAANAASVHQNTQPTIVLNKIIKT